MTEIVYKPGEFNFTFTGHAGYAEAGKDIVCAGISALMYAIPASLKGRGIKYFLDLGEPEGYVSVKAYPEIEQRCPCMVIFETIAEGLMLIANHYPSNVKYTKEEY